MMLLLLAGAAPAASPKATALAKDAEKAYKDNRYEDAARLLQQAWEADPVPKFLYNMARAYDQAAALEPAMDAYRRYVALPSDDTDPELVKKANLAMDRLRTLVAQREADKRIQDSEKQRLEGAAKDAQARADAEARKSRAQKAAYDAQAQAARDASSKKADSRKLIALGTGGLAVVGLGVAVGFGLAASGSHAAFDTATTVADKKAQEGAARTQALISDVGLGVGLAAAIAAAVLYPWGGSDADTAVSVAVAPTPGGGLLSLGGTF